MSFQKMKGELFHASQDSEIEELEPRAETYRDEKEGKVVFATDNQAYASMFLVSTDDSWTIKSGYKFNENDSKIWITVIGDEDRFREADKGGAIYTLPGKTFVADPSKHSSEWISKTTVKPLKKEIHNSGLDAMVENGVVVYFTSPEQFEEIKKADPDPVSRFPILSKLVSENEKRGLENPIKSHNISA